MSVEAPASRASAEAPAKLDVRAVTREMARLYRAHWLLLTLLAIVVLVPQSILDAAFGDIEIERISSIADIGKLAAIPLAVAINLGGEAFYSGVVAAVALHWRAGARRPPIREIARRIPYGSLIAIDLVIALGTMVGLVLLVVPGIVFATYTFTSSALVEVRGLGVRPALREGFRIVRGNFWRVLAIAVTVYVATEAAAQVASGLVHGLEREAVAHLIAEAVLEPFQGVAAVIVALSLLRIHGLRPRDVEGPGATGAER